MAVGVGRTVTVTACVLLHPPPSEFVPVTVYVYEPGGAPEKITVGPEVVLNKLLDSRYMHMKPCLKQLM